MTACTRVRYLWLPALLLLWGYLGWQRWTAPPPYCVGICWHNVADDIRARAQETT